MYLVTVFFPCAASAPAAIVWISCLRVVRIGVILPRRGNRRVLLQKPNAFVRDGLRGGRDVAPDGSRCRQFAQRESKAFDREPAIIPDVAQRLEYILPLHVS